MRISSSWWLTPFSGRASGGCLPPSPTAAAPAPEPAAALPPAASRPQPAAGPPAAAQPAPCVACARNRLRVSQKKHRTPPTWNACRVSEMQTSLYREQCHSTGREWRAVLRTHAGQPAAAASPPPKRSSSPLVARSVNRASRSAAPELLQTFTPRLTRPPRSSSPPLFSPVVVTSWNQYGGMYSSSPGSSVTAVHRRFPPQPPPSSSSAPAGAAEGSQPPPAASSGSSGGSCCSRRKRGWRNECSRSSWRGSHGSCQRGVERIGAFRNQICNQ